MDWIRLLATNISATGSHFQLLFVTFFITGIYGMESFSLISSMYLPAYARFALVRSGEDNRDVWDEIYDTKQKY